MGKLVVMDDFSADQVPRYFKLSAHQTLERDAMRYMFKAIRKSAQEDVGQTHPHDIAAATIGVIERPFNLLRTHAVDFCHGQRIDYAALTLAVICDSQVHKMRSKRHKGDDHIAHNIDMNIVWRAREVWDGAYHLANGTDYEDEKPSPECLLLAHINLFDDLHEILNFQNEYDADEIAHMVDVEIPNARRYLERGTAIGRDLHHMLGLFDKEFRRKQHNTAQKRENLLGALSLVPQPETP